MKNREWYKRTLVRKLKAAKVKLSLYNDCSGYKLQYKDKVVAGLTRRVSYLENEIKHLNILENAPRGAASSSFNGTPQSGVNLSLIRPRY